MTDNEFKKLSSEILKEIKSPNFKKLSKFSQKQLKKELERLTDKYLNPQK